MKYIGIGGILLMAMAWLLACRPTSPAAEKSCSELGDSVAQANSGDPNPVFKVIQPNGGEVFRVGETMRVRVTENLNTVNASAALKIVTPAGIKYVLIPPGTSGNLNVYSDCDLDFTIPDSLPSVYAPVGAVSLASDSVRVEVSEYDNGLFNDLSDDYFSIKDSP